MAVTATRERLIESLAAGFGDAIAALAGNGASPLPASVADVESGWTAEVRVSGALEGRVTLGFSDADLRRICALILALPTTEISDEAALDTFKEMCGQAISSVGGREESRGVRLALDRAGRPDPPGLAPEQVFAFRLPEDFTAHLLVRAEVSAPAADAAGLDHGEPGDSEAAATRNLDVLLDIELPLTVRFGRTELALQTLVRLGPGSVIDLHRSADEPVDVLVSGKVIARGEVVVVDGSYGVRVTEIVSAVERLRTMSA
jgi:flagellar motor switch protein FliN/FliY